MAKSKRQKAEDIIEEVTEVQDSVQNFFEKNQNRLLIVAGALVLLIALYAAFQYLYQQPREKLAAEQMWKAEYQFQRDSFALALENPGGGYYGFLDIIDNYGGTKAANLSKYYAGIAYLNLNRFDDAITYLNSYKANEELTHQTKAGTLGDAHAEKGDYAKALTNYKKAASFKNDLLTPYYLNKVGLLNNSQGDKQSALTAFERIKKEFPNSIEATDVDKYIAMLR